ncbi:MAG: uncharacterized protein HW380_673 [Magnetococcales bacterium]|nr:uncharacterized protein [Magnetococcales bacterium]
MNAELFLKWWPILGAVIQGVFLWLAWSMRKMFATKDEIKILQEELTERLCDHGQKIDMIEARLQAIPGGKDFQELTCKVNLVSGNIETIIARFEGVKESVTRVERQLDMLYRAHLAEEG